MPHQHHDHYSLDHASDVPALLGPAAGTLLLAGGGALEGSGILETFIELAGGPAAAFVIVPTAAGNRDAQGQPIAYDADAVLEPWRRLGLADVHMLHTADPAVADTAGFTAPLARAQAVWFNGGRQWNLVDSYAGTRTLDAFHALLSRGGVIGGSSAGATIQGDYLVRGAVSGPDVLMAPEPEHQQAFCFLRGVAVDQHIDTRSRWLDLQQILDVKPGLLGIGLSEATAIVVRGNRFEVIGNARVAIHDTTRTRAEGDTPYFTLQAGDRYDLGTRQVLT